MTGSETTYGCILQSNDKPIVKYDPPQSMRWIPITRPPIANGSYIVCTKTGKICAAHYYVGAGSFSGAGKNAVCWMPFPRAPIGVVGEVIPS